MSATRNTESPGVLVGNDAKPEFHAEQLPAGSAPSEATVQPRPAEGEELHKSAGGADAASTLTGATSADVHTGYGKPMQGQENHEIRHDGQHTRKRVGAGLEGVGASVGDDSVRAKGADLPEGIVKGSRGKHTEDYPGAEERVPESAETVASERR
ncbi:hypothetical protein PG994_005110 [Apiospora phragmitis]|uniref:Uncharacterized protein n=1 Tax=Apiospora phragmitis TaxID=2905665 RepID=A0ABR1VV66_9PEZI